MRPELPTHAVQILLSTWNGALWLPELLESLQRQTFKHWELLIRDDGSSDQTLRILLDWQALYPEKVVCLLLDGEHRGSSNSFSRLVEASTAPYLMFCDQDDVWFPEKVELQYTAMRMFEGEYGAETPLLVHSDLAVVDARKQLLAPSFWEYRGLDIGQGKQAYLLNNVVTGCATLFNRTAAEMAFPLPDGAMQHDRWLALVCAWFGQIRAIQHSLLLYRQHGANELGAAAGGISGLETRVNDWSAQADAFLKRFSDWLTVKDYKLVEALADLRHLHGWNRRRHIIRHRLFKRGVFGVVALLLFA